MSGCAVESGFSIRDGSIQQSAFELMCVGRGRVTGRDLRERQLRFGPSDNVSGVGVVWKLRCWAALQGESEVEEARGSDPIISDKHPLVPGTCLLFIPSASGASLGLVCLNDDRFDQSC